MKNCFFIFFVSLLFVYTATGQNLYVSWSDGNDANDGTSIGSPLKTIEEARLRVRALNNNMKQDINVYLRGGTHFVSETINFTSADSGTNGYRVIYRNQPNELPIVSGGRQILNWKNEGLGIWSAAVGNDWSFRQLYVGGNKRIRARTPNVGSYYTSLNWSNRKENVNSSEIANWDNLNEVEIAEIKSFIQFRYRINSFTTSNGKSTITPREPDRTNMFGWQSVPSGSSSYFYENAYEFIDQDGEWYFNTDENRVYYKKTGSENMSTAQVIAPNIETIFKFSGYAKNITLFGLQISHANWDKPSFEGNMPSQGGLYKYYDQNNAKTFTFAPGAITLVTCSDIHIERNKIQHVGANGINFHGNTKDNVVLGNLFYEIADAGIVVGAQHPAGFGLNLNPNTNEDELIANNYFYKMGTDYTGHGVMGTSTVRMNVIHNEFEDMKSFALNTGFGLTNIANDPFEGSNLSYNKFHNVAHTASDVSALHTIGNGKGGLIQGNYFSDIPGITIPVGNSSTNIVGHGVYLDNDSRNYTVLNNAFDNLGKSFIVSWGTINGTGTDSPNYDVNNYGDSNNSSAKQNIIANAGIESSYADIKSLAGNFNSIGKNLNPNYNYSWTIADFRFNEKDDDIVRYTVNDPTPEPLGLDVVTTAGDVYSENGSLKLVDNKTNSLVSVTKKFKSLENTMMFSFKAKASQTNKSAYYMLRENGVEKVKFAFASNGQMRCWSGSTVINLGAYNANTFYFVDIQANPKTDTFHVNVNDVRVASNVSFSSNAGEIDEVHIQTGDITTGTHLVDWFNLIANF